ncbi:hypothetical protein N7468_005001 [Penicillium chermesinum]|uniref:NGG1 interacting factor Nif3 n=1 Tax=Penicillium chermesinum TaxID=63820 RepID=A0A9W9TML5_9EURO|nr:uncharacterized protein N7468_005001 [Penicillium chermesinum]KAJ5232045.1 hypothetical protein N7468_005001 [Penicillium chermesinum]
MASSAPSCSPFTRTVVSSMRKLYPEALADKSFDNTGLLLEAPFDPTKRRQRNSVLLTIDLTAAVAEEAIARRDSVVVAYHPIIFRGLKSITLSDPQQRTLLRLVQHGISVYSPHTAVDTVPGGMADWLCDVPKTAPTVAAANLLHQIPHKRSTIHPSPPASIPEGFESAGAGRLVVFNESQPLAHLIDHIGRGIGLPGGIPIALPQGKSVNDIRIRTVGMCPGSGAGVLLRNGTPLPHLLLTGEMSHHETLSATERGSVVIALSHSNSERGYLRAIMQLKLYHDLSRRWKRDREQGLRALQESSKQGGAAPAASYEDMYNDELLEVSVSDADRDPFGIMVYRG